MIPNKVTLRELWDMKSKEYFDASRDKFGVPEKSFMQCQIEATTDFGTEELDYYNQQLKKRWNYFMNRDQQVVWADTTHDDSRICVVCKKLCKYPVHREKYREVVVSKAEKGFRQDELDKILENLPEGIK